MSNINVSRFSGHLTGGDMKLFPYSLRGLRAIPSANLYHGNTLGKNFPDRERKCSKVGIAPGDTLVINHRLLQLSAKSQKPFQFRLLTLIQKSFSTRFSTDLLKKSRE